MKLSSFLIGMLTVSLVMGILSLIIINLGDTYGRTASEYNVSVYNKMDDLSSNVEQVQTRVQNVSSSESGIFDIIGKLFSGGIQAAKTTAKSTEVANEMVMTSLDSTGSQLGASGGLLRQYLLAVLVVVVAIAILLSIILKWYT